MCENLRKGRVPSRRNTWGYRHPEDSGIKKILGEAYPLCTQKGCLEGEGEARATLASSSLLPNPQILLAGLFSS